MKTKSEKKSQVNSGSDVLHIKVSEELAKDSKKVLFPKKLAKANEILANLSLND